MSTGPPLSRPAREVELSREEAMDDMAKPSSHAAGTTDLNNVRCSIDALAAAVRELTRVEAMRGANEALASHTDLYDPQFFHEIIDGKR